MTDEQNDAVPQKYGNKAWYEFDNYGGDRGKRTVTRAAKGLAAMETLLTGAKKVWTPFKNFRLYKKNGNLDTALKDFHSVEPVLTLPYKNAMRSRKLRGYSRAVMGFVGDRRLILSLDGDRYSYLPVLEIRSATDALFDKIVYKIEKKNIKHVENKSKQI